MRSGAAGWRFWLATLATLLGLAVTGSAGVWQLSRASAKEALQAERERRSGQPVLDGRSLAAGGGLDELLQRRIVLRGRWLSTRTVYLDNRPMQGRVGFYVVTPLALADAPVTVLVQRGWVPRDFQDRTRLPPVASPDGVVELQGRIAPAPGKLYEFESSAPGAIRQNLDLERFAREIGTPLVPVTVQQTGAPGDGLLRDWPQAEAGIDKHYGYAFQWFAMGAVMLLLYGWFQIVKRFLLHR